jgi:cytochrome c biogenesis protein CcmG, thiol:disulfide interchange protein DsbE
MVPGIATQRTRLPRPLALGFAAVIVGATVVAFAWSTLPLGRAQGVTGPTRVGIIGRQVEGGGTRVGDPAPDFEWVAPDGRTLRLSSLEGRPVVLNFWATWCDPCKAEMPLLDAAAASDGHVTFLAVDLDEDGAKIRSFFDAQGIRTLEPLLDVGGATSRHYGLGGVPSTYFIDATGTIRYVQLGQLDQQKLDGALATLR